MSKRDFPVYRPEENAPYNGKWADADTGGGRCPDGLCIASRNNNITGTTYPTQEEIDAYEAKVAARSDFRGQEEREGTLAETYGHPPFAGEPIEVSVPAHTGWIAALFGKH